MDMFPMEEKRHRSDRALHATHKLLQNGSVHGRKLQRVYLRDEKKNKLDEKESTTTHNNTQQRDFKDRRLHANNEN